MDIIKNYKTNTAYLDMCTNIDIFIKNQNKFFKEISEVIAIETLAISKTKLKPHIRLSLERILTFLIMTAYILSSVSYLPTMIYSNLPLKDMINNILSLDIEKNLGSILTTELKEQFYLIKNECLSIRNTSDFELISTLISFSLHENTDIKPYERGIKYGIKRIKKIVQENELNYRFCNEYPEFKINNAFR